GLGAPLLESFLAHQLVADQFQAILKPALLPGVGLGLFGMLLNITRTFRSIPNTPKYHPHVSSLWGAIVSSLHSGITEELLYRFLGVSFSAWLLSRIWHTPAGLPTPAIFWFIIIFGAVVGAIQSVVGLASLIEALDYDETPV